MTTKRAKTKTTAGDRKACKKPAAGKPEHPPPGLTREHVKTLPEREKNALRAEALDLVTKGQAATGTEALRLSAPDRERLAELIRCGMLPGGDPPPPERITPDRAAELRERAQRMIEGKPVSPFLRSEAEAARVLKHLNDFTKAILEAANDKLTEGHRTLAAALSAWVLRTMKDVSTELTEDEARLFAAMITRTDTMQDGETPKYMTQREIAAALGVSPMAVKRREDKLRRDHPALACWLAKNKIDRKPRGTRKRTVTKRKQSA